MLANQIARSMPDVLVFPELDFIGLLMASGDRYVRCLSAQRLLALLRQDNKLDDIGLSRNEWTVIAKKCAGKGILVLLTQVAMSFARHSGRDEPRVVLFQRGTLLSVTREITNLAPSAKFIHIVRDPRAAVSSIVGIKAARFTKYDKKGMGRGDAIGLSKNWLKYMRRVDDLRERMSDAVLQIQYEDVCREREEYLRRIAEFLRVLYSPAECDNAGLAVGADELELHTNIDSEPMLERLFAWREELTGWRGFLVEYVIGDRLEVYGYEPYFSKGVGAGKRIGYLVRGWLEYMVESVGLLSRRLAVLCKSPRLFMRMIRLKMKSGAK
jgi:hypothetical protein